MAALRNQTAWALATLWLVGAWPAVASAERPLAVGVKPAAPFAMQRDDGSWTGLAVDLWSEVARDLDLRFELHERDLAGLLDDVAAGRLDAGLGALTVTSERETRLDFTHPFYTSGLGIAVSEHGQGSWSSALWQMLSWGFVRAVVVLGVVLLAAGAVIWLLERRRNPEQFGGEAPHGLGSGFWWAAVTMTTVGYGDKAPRSAAGRAFAVFWMFFSIVTISGFTATIASTLTLSQLGSSVRGPDDLARVRVGAVAGTTSSEYLEGRRIGFRGQPSPEAALSALAAGELDAVVHDAPILRFLLNERWQGEVRLLPFRLERQDYGIALPESSALRERLNRSLLGVLASSSWREVVKRHLGAEDG